MPYPKETHSHHSPQNDTRLYFDKSLKTVPDIVRMMNDQSCVENKYQVVAATSSGGIRYIYCNHNKTSNTSKGTKSTTTHSRKAESTEEKCNFKLLIKYDDEHKQWYLRQNAGHCLEHTGHIPIKREHNEQGKRNISSEVLKDVEEFIDRNVSRGVVKEFVEFKTGHVMSKESVSKMKQTMSVNMYKGDEGESTADVFVRKMENDDNVEFVAYFGSYSEAEKIVKVRKRTTRRRKRRKTDGQEEDQDEREYSSQCVEA